MIRQDKFQPGDKVEFIPEDEYDGAQIGERHRTKYGKGPYEVEEVEEVGAGVEGIGHTQFVSVNDGEIYSGYWFKPVRGSAP